MAVLLSPIGNGAQFFTFGGLPLSGGLLWTYLAGTSTPQTSYTTSLGNVANANPIVLGPDGRPPAEIWLTQGVAYKFSLLDSLSNPISSYDNILGINDFNSVNIPGTLTVGGNTTLTNLSVTGNTTLGDAAGDALTINPSNVSWPGNPTHSGNHTFSAALSTASTTIGVAGGAIGPGPIIPGSPFTPTGSNTVNCSVFPQTGGSNYIRIGNICLVWGIIQIDPTVASTATSFYLTLPIASTFSSGLELAGGAIVANPAVQNYSIFVSAVAPDNKASFGFFCGTDVTVRFASYWYAYTIQ